MAKEILHSQSRLGDRRWGTLGEFKDPDIERRA